MKWSDNEEEQQKYWKELNTIYHPKIGKLKKKPMNLYERYIYHKRSAQEKGDLKEVKRLRIAYTQTARGLGFKLIGDEMGEGFQFHHLTKNIVIQIPSFIHRSTYHNIWTGKGMKEVNEKTMKWLIYGDFK